MFGLDGYIANLSDGVAAGLVVAVAVLLGLRHATDPDHLTAVATLIATSRERTGRLAARLGLAWGAGHATTLFAAGLPVVLFRSYLPERVVEGAELAVGVLIVGLAVRLLVRWRRGALRAPHVHAHDHVGTSHCHLHEHEAAPLHDHRHAARARTPLQAYAIGLVHGLGGSAGVGVLLLAGIESRTLAVAALVLFAACTAVSMAALSTGLGLTLGLRRVRRSFHAVAPVFACASLAFGVWYALGALSIAPYVF